MTRPLPDQQLLRSFNQLVARTRIVGGATVPDAHGLVQEFGITGFDLATPVSAILVVTKPCQLVEWTIDSPQVGNVSISLQWAAWSIPRVWSDITGSGTRPTLAGQSTNGSGDFTGWTGPLLFQRREALMMTVDDASGVEQITLALYMKELPVSMGSGLHT